MNRYTFVALAALVVVALADNSKNPKPQEGCSVQNYETSYNDYLTGKAQLHPTREAEDKEPSLYYADNRIWHPQHVVAAWARNFMRQNNDCRRAIFTSFDDIIHTSSNPQVFATQIRSFGQSMCNNPCVAQFKDTVLKADGRFKDGLKRYMRNPSDDINPLISKTIDMIEAAVCSKPATAPSAPASTEFCYERFSQASTQIFTDHSKYSISVPQSCWLVLKSNEASRVIKEFNGAQIPDASTRDCVAKTGSKIEEMFSFFDKNFIYNPSQKMGESASSATLSSDATSTTLSSIMGLRSLIQAFVATIFISLQALLFN